MLPLKAYFQKGHCNLINVMKRIFFNPNYDVFLKVTKYFCCINLTDYL